MRRPFSFVKQLGAHLTGPTILLWGFLLSGIGSSFAWEAIHNEARLQFQIEMEDVAMRIQNRFQDYENILIQARSFMKVKGTVTHADFRAYYRDLRLSQRFPGIRGIGYSVHFPAERLEKHLREVRAAMPGYQVWPGGLRAEYTSILFLEPLDDRNRRAIGFDMFTEPTRRAAMEAARDSGETRLTGRVHLVQDGGQPSLGFLLYLPLYRNPSDPETPSERKKALAGYVYAPFRAPDFFGGIFPPSVAQDLQVTFEVFDGEGFAEDSLLFDLGADEKRLSWTERLESMEGVRTLRLGAREWTIRFRSRPELLSLGNRLMPVALFLAGMVVTLFLAGLHRAVRKAWAAERALLENETRARQVLEQKVNERTFELLRERSYLNAVLENVDASIMACDGEGRITYMNRLARENFGSPGADISTPLPGLPIEEHPLARVIREGQFSGVDFVQTKENGGTRIHSSSGRVIRDSEGRIVGAVLVLHDVTEAQESREKLRESNRAFQAANEELEAFAYSVSHDLRGPLRGVDGFSQALLEDYGDRLDGEGKKYLGFIREGIQKMGHLIDDLLNLSRLTRMELVKTRVSLTAISVRILERMSREEPGRDVRWTVEPDLWVDADPGLLTAQMENLLGNAWKFTSRTPEARIEVGSKSADGSRVYFVRDNGSGFDMKHSHKLFGAFQRLHSSRDFAGTGIGLATVRRVVNRHGGRIWAEAEPGRGATFFFTLPAASRAADAGSREIDAT